MCFQVPHAHSRHRDDGLLRTHPTSRQCMQSIFTTFAFVVSPVISLRRLAIAVVSSMMLLAAMKEMSRSLLNYVGSTLPE